MAITLDQVRLGKDYIWTQGDGTKTTVTIISSLVHFGVMDRVVVAYKIADGTLNVKDVPLNRLDRAMATKKETYRLGWLRINGEPILMMVKGADIQSLPNNPGFLEWETQVIEASVTYVAQD